MNTAENSFWNVFKGEMRGFSFIFWKYLWRSCLLLSLLLFSVLLFGDVKGPTPFYIYVICYFYCLFICFFPAVVIASLAVFWRMAGAWILFPIIVVPALTFFGIWLFSGTLSGLGMDIWTAIKASSADHDWPSIQQLLKIGPAARVPPLALIAAVLLLPFLLFDSIIVLFDPQVVWAYAKFIFSFALVFSLGFIPSVLSSFVILSLSFVRRIKQRIKNNSV